MRAEVSVDYFQIALKSEDSVRTSLFPVPGDKSFKLHIKSANIGSVHLTLKYPKST